MNIQIFGSKKNNDSKKAERYFKERGIKFQYIDMNEKGMARGEFDSVLRSVPLEEMINHNCKDKANLSLLEYLSKEDQIEKLYECQHLIMTPIVRNGKQATAGYKPEVWKNWQ